jgi:hypothetical protein
LPLSWLSQVTDQFARVDVVHDRATRNHNVEILARLAGLVAPGATLPAFRAKLASDSKIRERVQRGLGNQVNAAAVAAVATIGPASLDVFLTAKTQATVAAIACQYANCRFVDEFHCFCLKKTPLAAGLLCS